MKKILALFTASVICLAAFASCASDSEKDNTEKITDGTQAVTDGSVVIPDGYESVDARVFAMNGPTGMGLVKMIEDAEAGRTANRYDFTLSSSADSIKAEIIKGDFDFAAIPTNLAAVLYNKTEGGLVIAAVNTLGVLYILENGDTVKSVADLEGKTVAVTGQGAVPEYAFNYIIKNAGINCEVEYYADASELAAKVISGDVSLAMLPVPYATQVVTKNTDVRLALSVTDEFKNAAKSDPGDLCQACIVVNRTFYEKNPDAVAMFLREYESSVDFVLKNQADAAKLMAKHKITPSEEVALAAIPKANLVCITGDEMKSALDGFFGILYEANPASVGGKLPDDKIYG